MSSNLQWLMNLQRFGMQPGLDTMRRLLERLDRPDEGPLLVLVGGTNGKGSTASLLASMLQAAGRRTGLFTSPHLTSVMERFRVDGRDLELELLEAVLVRLKPLAQELSASFFEVMVAAAWLLFQQQRCDAVVLEVGLGGRFDATNASQPSLSVITNVELDHMDVLGSTTELIAADKAWLMRPDRPLVTAATAGALTVIRRHALETGAPVLALGKEFNLQVLASDWTGNRIRVTQADWKLELTAPLPGRHQAVNAAVASVAAHQLGLPDQAIVQGAAAADWPGRLERVRASGRNWLLDGAHNPAGARALREAITELEARPALLVLGLTSDKDIHGIVAELAGLAPQVVATRSELSPRSHNPHELLELLPPLAVAAASPAEAVATAISMTRDDELIVVAGSLYLLGELRPLLTGQKAESFERWQ